MIQVFLSYARGDGITAATKLRGELTAMGFSVWRDIEEMQGGLAWKKQLYQALARVDAVLVLLTPAAVASQSVAWEWETGQAMDKRVIPLLVSTCDVPAELQVLHYHDLRDLTGYTLSLARLARDLMAIAVQARGAAAVTEPGDQITVIGVDNAVAARGAMVIKQSGGTPLDAIAVTQMLAALRAQPTDGLSSGQMTELRQILSSLQAQVEGVSQGLDDLNVGQQRILARFDVMEQRDLSPILARLDAQQSDLAAAVLDALETRTFPADELGRHLATIHMALAEINVRAAHIADRQLVEAARKVDQRADDPSLEVKHKLKVTIPIVPLLLSYEGELGLSTSRKLREVWQALQEWVTGQRPDA